MRDQKSKSPVRACGQSFPHLGYGGRNRGTSGFIPVPVTKVTVVSGRTAGEDRIGSARDRRGGDQRAVPGSSWPWTTTRLPVSGAPMKSPRWVPVQVQQWANWFSSVMTQSSVMWKSGKAGADGGDPLGNLLRAVDREMAGLTVVGEGGEDL